MRDKTTNGEISNQELLDILVEHASEEAINGLNESAKEIEGWIEEFQKEETISAEDLELIQDLFIRAKIKYLQGYQPFSFYKLLPSVDLLSCFVSLVTPELAKKPTISKLVLELCSHGDWQVIFNVELPSLTGLTPKNLRYGDQLSQSEYNDKVSARRTVVERLNELTKTYPVPSFAEIRKAIIAHIEEKKSSDFNYRAAFGEYEVEARVKEANRVLDNIAALVDEFKERRELLLSNGLSDERVARIFLDRIGEKQCYRIQTIIREEEQGQKVRDAIRENCHPNLAEHPVINGLFIELAKAPKKIFTAEPASTPIERKKPKDETPSTNDEPAVTSWKRPLAFILLGLVAAYFLPITLASFAATVAVKVVIGLVIGLIANNVAENLFGSSAAKPVAPESAPVQAPVQPEVTAEHKQSAAASPSRKPRQVQR